MGTQTIHVPYEQGNFQGTQRSLDEDVPKHEGAVAISYPPERKYALGQKKNTISYLACIVLPTYNEAPNITAMLNSIFHEQQLHRYGNVELSVLVVDDNSPDGTARLVRMYGKKNRRVHLLLRKEKNGLGAAYIAGMQHAMRVLKPDIILEMDADGQHNPADIHRLITEIKNGSDFVVGSRYVPEGGVPKGWKFHRKLISRCANQYTRTMLNTGGVSDCTGGFRAIRTSLLQSIDFDQLHVKGYAFQVTLLDACVQRRAVVKEIPIRFRERMHGESKMRAQDMVVGGLMLAALRFKRFFTPSPHSIGHREQRTTSAVSDTHAKRV